MSAGANLGFWAKCPGCGHCWIAAYYPQELGIFAGICAKAKCPKGCADRPLVAKQENGELQEEGAK